MNTEAAALCASDPPGLQPDELPALAKAVLLYFCAGLGLLVLLGTFSFQWQRFMGGQGDFLAFYAGASLAGHDGLYSPAVVRGVQRRSAGFTSDALPYTRLPFYAAALKPLASLPYLTAYWVFQFLNMAAAACFAWGAAHVWQLRAAILLFFPLAVGIYVGQDIPLILCIWMAAILLHKSGRDAAAGFVLSLCILKFHLFVLVPLALIRHRKWRLIGGALAGLAAWLALSTLVAGPDWPRQYIALLSSPAIVPRLYTAPNVGGILSGSPLAGIVALAVFLIFLFAVMRLRDFEAGLALALAGGVLLNTHSFIQDCAFLLPALILAIRHGSRSARSVALFLMTPAPYALLLLAHGVPFLAGLAALALLLSARLRSPVPAEAAA